MIKPPLKVSLLFHAKLQGVAAGSICVATAALYAYNGFFSMKLSIVCFGAWLLGLATARLFPFRAAGETNENFRHLEAIMSFLSLVIPARIANEELGDALEEMNRQLAAGCPRWKIKLRAISSILWALFHTVCDTISRFVSILNR